MAKAADVYAAPELSAALREQLQTSDVLWMPNTIIADTKLTPGAKFLYSVLLNHSWKGALSLRRTASSRVKSAHRYERRATTLMNSSARNHRRRNLRRLSFRHAFHGTVRAVRQSAAHRSLFN
jgi:hypothetical protein